MNKILVTTIVLLILLASPALAQIPDSRQFRSELISYMQSEKDSIYVQDRKKQEKIGGRKCNDSLITFNHTSKAGEKIFKITTFLPENHCCHRIILRPEDRGRRFDASTSSATEAQQSVGP